MTSEACPGVYAGLKGWTTRDFLDGFWNNHVWGAGAKTSRRNKTEDIWEWGNSWHLATYWTCDLRERQNESFELTRGRNDSQLNFTYSFFGRKIINNILNMVSLKLHEGFFKDGVSSSTHQKLGRANIYVNLNIWISGTEQIVEYMESIPKGEDKEKNQEKNVTTLGFTGCSYT